MVNIGKIRELYIASDVFDTIDNGNLKKLNYIKWKNYINECDLFIWFENTKDGQEVSSKIDTIPDDFKESFVSLFDYTRCYTDYNIKNTSYSISVVFYKELKRIVISFERKTMISDLKLFLEMANYLGALLLQDGKEIIDEDVMKRLENDENIILG